MHRAVRIVPNPLRGRCGDALQVRRNVLASARALTMRKLSFLSSSACAAAISFVAFGASAHIELIDPPPRYALPANKSCPCGDGDSNRRCQVTAAESTDPNRSATVTTFEAGATITVVAEEYVDHEGRMRVAFDPSGADLADFNRNILADVSDPDQAGLSRTNPRVWEFDVKLPSEPCENCTLQVIQAMSGGPENPVLDPAPLSTYYTCADIRIVAAGTLSEGDGLAPGGDGAVLEAQGGAANAGTGGAGSEDDGESGSRAVADASDEEGDESGCALRPAHGNASWLWALAPIAWFGTRRLRRRSR